MIIYTPKVEKQKIIWERYPMEGEIGIRILSGLPTPCAPDDPKAEILLLPYTDAGGAGGGLLMRRPNCAARVNGLPVLGLTALHDQDEISLGMMPESRLYYSVELHTPVVPFHEGPTPIRCARSKVQIVEGTPAVRCKCGLWYIESPELKAYSYGDTCIGCGEPTKSENQWTPPPVRRHISLPLESYIQEVRKRAEELAACSADVVSVAG